MTTLVGPRWCIYFDLRAWWVGARFAKHHVYVCLLPTLVIRVRLRRVATL